LKYRTDSLEQHVGFQERYIESLKRVLKGEVVTPLDTTMLTMPQTEEITD
jgi:hypothetical protein